MELPHVQRFAFSRHLWCGREEEREGLRESLFGLKKRGVKEVILVPDDQRGPLIDRWYYGKHDIHLLEPEWAYTFRSHGPGVREDSKTVVENLEEWFARLWRVDDVCGDSDADGDGRGQVPLCPPKVMVKSIRRNGSRMAAFKDGLWEIQKEMGDMRVWRSWTPPERDLLAIR